MTPSAAEAGSFNNVNEHILNLILMWIVLILSVVKVNFAHVAFYLVVAGQSQSICHSRLLVISCTSAVHIDGMDRTQVRRGVGVRFPADGQSIGTRMVYWPPAHARCVLRPGLFHHQRPRSLPVWILPWCRLRDLSLPTQSPPSEATNWLMAQETALTMNGVEEGRGAMLIHVSRQSDLRPNLPASAVSLVCA